MALHSIFLSVRINLADFPYLCLAIVPQPAKGQAEHRANESIITLLYIIKERMSMNIPTNVKYTNEHEWIRVEGDVAYVGITDYAQQQLGDIVFVDVQTVGETLAAGEVFGTIEVVKTISDLFLPVAGEVIEQNENLADQPELVNKDPYGEGWIIKITPAADADFSQLLDADAYKALVNA